MPHGLDMVFVFGVLKTWCSQDYRSQMIVGIFSDDHGYTRGGTGNVLDGTDADDALLESLGFHFTACDLGELNNADYMVR